MKKFTKLLSLLLAVVMMLGLAACGSNGHRDCCTYCCRRVR